MTHGKNWFLKFERQLRNACLPYYKLVDARACQQGTGKETSSERQTFSEAFGKAAVFSPLPP